MRDVFTAHLASGRNPLYTACGEPWQGWQAPFNNRELELPPHHQPRPHQDRVRQCQTCFRRALELSLTVDPTRRPRPHQGDDHG